ncbi:hypothetical protein PybrP1_004751 [[Pythium] brassicae (nom. inval.)]|nr:hypothetical protein PybrP1_004751 [[Pythium] brassicae (nom. inval.)]
MAAGASLATLLLFATSVSALHLLPTPSLPTRHCISQFYINRWWTMCACAVTADVIVLDESTDEETAVRVPAPRSADTDAVPPSKKQRVDAAKAELKPTRATTTHDSDAVDIAEEAGRRSRRSFADTLSYIELQAQQRAFEQLQSRAHKRVLKAAAQKKPAPKPKGVAAPRGLPTESKLAPSSKPAPSPSKPLRTAAGAVNAALSAQNPTPAALRMADGSKQPIVAPTSSGNPRQGAGASSEPAAVVTKPFFSASTAPAAEASKTEAATAAQAPIPAASTATVGEGRSLFAIGASTEATKSVIAAKFVTGISKPASARSTAPSRPTSLTSKSVAGGSKPPAQLAKSNPVYDSDSDFEPPPAKNTVSSLFKNTSMPVLVTETLQAPGHSTPPRHDAKKSHVVVQETIEIDSDEETYADDEEVELFFARHRHAASDSDENFIPKKSKRARRNGPAKKSEHRKKTSSTGSRSYSSSAYKHAEAPPIATDILPVRRDASNTVVHNTSWRQCYFDEAPVNVLPSRTGCARDQCLMSQIDPPLTAYGESSSWLVVQICSTLI